MSSARCLVLIAQARVPERNVARQKPAIQSATYLSYAASNAVDGVISLNVACNLAAVHSWWAVDLVERFLIRSLIVTTDTNAVQGNLRFYTFWVILIMADSLI